MDDYFEEFDKRFKEEMAKSDALPKGLVPGKIFSISVADGYAYYEVVKVNKRTVRIKWRKDLCPDEYCYYGWGAGGSFPISLIEPLVDGEERIAEMFAEQRKQETPNVNKN